MGVQLFRTRFQAHLRAVDAARASARAAAAAAISKGRRQDEEEQLRDAASSERIDAAVAMAQHREAVLAEAVKASSEATEAAETAAKAAAQEAGISTLITYSGCDSQWRPGPREGFIPLKSQQGFLLWHSTQ